MKKLMFLAAAATLAGAASAASIYDYKASVKYVDFKAATVKNLNNKSAYCFLKVVKSATLTGYLVTPIDCACDCRIPTDDGPCGRFGELPGFLVLQNKASNKYSDQYGMSHVKLMPANLLTEWWADKAAKKVGDKLQAQGYLFAGVGKRDVPDPIESPFYGLGDRDPEMDFRTAGTQFLFGWLNVVEDDFIEPFLDHAGFGKAKINKTEDIEGDNGNPCLWVGPQPGVKFICLDELSGTLIGGSYACLRNAQRRVKGTNQLADGYALLYSTDMYAFEEGWLCQGWDDHTENMTSAGNNNRLPQIFGADTMFMYNVVCGTWSIKANAKVELSFNKKSPDPLCTEREYVFGCAKRIDKNVAGNAKTLPDQLKNFEATFDLATKGNAAARAILNQFQGNFIKKWFDMAPIQ